MLKTIQLNNEFLNKVKQMKRLAISVWFPYNMTWEIHFQTNQIAFTEWIWRTVAFIHRSLGFVALTQRKVECVQVVSKLQTDRLLTHAPWFWIITPPLFQSWIKVCCMAVWWRRMRPLNSFYSSPKSHSEAGFQKYFKHTASMNSKATESDWYL